MAVFAWVNWHAWAGVAIEPYPKLHAWLERIRARPGAYAGFGIPTRGKPMTKEEEEEVNKAVSEWIQAGNKRD